MANDFQRKINQTDKTENTKEFETQMKLNKSQSPFKVTASQSVNQDNYDTMTSP